VSWQAAALVILALAIVAGFAWFERSRPSARIVAAVAALAALAVAGRVALAPIPNPVATTDVALLAGYTLGGGPGFAVGAIAGLVSNFWLGQGPWTPWQMLAWGACGLAGAAFARLIRRRVAFAALCCVLGFAFSAVMDLWIWVTYLPHTWQALAVTIGQGFSYDTAHAVGNVVIALTIGPELRRLLERYDRRLRTEVVWA
jgi:energy-coupling factor transport system substrate-specific component